MAKKSKRPINLDGWKARHAQRCMEKRLGNDLPAFLRMSRERERELVESGPAATEQDDRAARLRGQREPRQRGDVVPGGVLAAARRILEEPS